MEVLVAVQPEDSADQNLFTMAFLAIESCATRTLMRMGLVAENNRRNF